MFTILLVEDTTVLAEQISDTLKMENYRVVVAANGKVALDLLSAVSPDLVITDLLMPSVNGFELIQAIRTDERTAGIPIVVLSARTDEGAIGSVEQLSIDRFLKKPCKPSVLLETVRQILSKEDRS